MVLGLAKMNMKRLLVHISINSSKNMARVNFWKWDLKTTKKFIQDVWLFLFGGHSRVIEEKTVTLQISGEKYVIKMNW